MTPTSNAFTRFEHLVIFPYMHYTETHLPAEVRIEPETANDHDAIRGVVQAAFVDHQTAADLVELTRTSANFVPQLSLVARDGDEVVGHVILSHVDVVDEANVRRRALTLSPLSVTPSSQGQGIGGSLIRAGLDAADQLGESLVILEGSPNYYPRFGFRPASEFGIAIDLPDWAPPEAAMVYPLTNYDPAVKGKLVYPPAFAATGSAA